jgi:hypothetical protein
MLSDAHSTSDSQVLQTCNEVEVRQGCTAVTASATGGRYQQQCWAQKLLDRQTTTVAVPVTACHVLRQLVAWHIVLHARSTGTKDWVSPQSQGPLMPTEFCNLYLYLTHLRLCHRRC